MRNLKILAGLIFAFSFLIPIEYRINLYFIETSQVTEKLEKRYDDMKVAHEMIKDKTVLLLEERGKLKSKLSRRPDDLKYKLEYLEAMGSKNPSQDYWTPYVEQFSNINSQLIDLYPELTESINQENEAIEKITGPIKITKNESAPRWSEAGYDIYRDLDMQEKRLTLNKYELKKAEADEDYRRGIERIEKVFGGGSTNMGEIIKIIANELKLREQKYVEPFRLQVEKSYSIETKKLNWLIEKGFPTFEKLSRIFLPLGLLLSFSLFLIATIVGGTIKP